MSEPNDKQVEPDGIGWCSSCDKIHEVERPKCPTCGDWLIFASDDKPEAPEQPKCDGDHPEPKCGDKQCWLNEQPKVGELPPLDVMRWDPTLHEGDYGGWRVDMEKSANTGQWVKCADFLAEQQVSAGLREENAVLTKKGQDLCATLGNLGIHIRELGLRNAGKMGEWKFRNIRAEAAEASLAEANAENETAMGFLGAAHRVVAMREAELATLKAQEAPEKAWERGWNAGLAVFQKAWPCDPYTSPSTKEGQ